MIKAVIFDFDGVVVDSETQYVLRLIKFAKTKNVDLSFDVAKKVVGTSKIDNMKLMGEIFNCDGSTIRKEYDIFKNKMENAIDYKAIINLDCLELLKYLKHNNYLTALATSTTREMLNIKLKAVNIQSMFDIVVAGDDVRNFKPAPDIYYRAMNLLGIESDSCIAIEDSPSGIKAAKGAGIYTIAKKNININLDQSKADLVLCDLREVIHHFQL